MKKKEEENSLPAMAARVIGTAPEDQTESTDEKLRTLEKNVDVTPICYMPPNGGKGVLSRVEGGVACVGRRAAAAVRRVALARGPGAAPR